MNNNSFDIRIEQYLPTGIFIIIDKLFNSFSKYNSF